MKLPKLAAFTKMCAIVCWEISTIHRREGGRKGEDGRGGRKGKEK